MDTASTTYLEPSSLPTDPPKIFRSTFPNEMKIVDSSRCYENVKRSVGIAKIAVCSQTVM